MRCSGYSACESARPTSWWCSAHARRLYHFSESPTFPPRKQKLANSPPPSTHTKWLPYGSRRRRQG